MHAAIIATERRSAQLLSATLSPYLQNLTFKILGSLWQTKSCLLALKPGASEIWVARHLATDGLIEALAGSSSSLTLRKLVIADSPISDASSECWKNFKSLASVHIKSGLITMKSLQEIVTNPSIEDLFLQCRRVSALDVAKCALGLPALTSKLKRLDLRQESDVQEATVEFLALLRTVAPAVRQALRHLQFTYHLSPESLREIIILCPNLQELPTNFGVSLSWLKTLPVDSIANIETISIKDTSTIDQGDIDWIASTFPRLSQLGFESVQFNATSLSGLQSLQVFTATLSSGKWVCTKFPPILREIKLNLPRGDAVGTVEMCSFVFDLAAQVPGLQALHLTPHTLSREEFELLLSSMQHLHTLDLHGGGRPAGGPPPSPLEFSHPSLTAYDNIRVKDAFLVPTQMRRLQSVRDIEDSMPQIGQGRFPNINRLGTSQNAHIDLSPLTCLRNLRSFHAGNMLDRGWSSLARLSSIQSLSISAMLREGTLETLFPALPYLRVVQVVAFRPGAVLTSLAWLRHPLLESFSYKGSISVFEDAPLIVEGARLPSLVSFSIGAGETSENDERVYIQVSGLESLQDATFRAAEERSLDLELRNCPNLASLTVDCTAIDRLDLNVVPSLVKLDLESSNFGPEPIVSVIAPALRVVEHEGDEEGDNEVVVEKVLSQAPLACLVEPE